MTSAVDEADDAEFDEAEFEDLPNTDVEVELHVHFGMAGSFPLRLAELFFADDGLYIVEYSYITPLMGLGTRKHHREADAMAAVYEHHGLDEVLLQGDSFTWLNYDAVDRVAVHGGGRIGRPKLTVYETDGRSHAYRLHEEREWRQLVAALEECGDRHGFPTDSALGLGLDPTENVRRFFG